jgi:hypothetical protein
MHNRQSKAVLADYEKRICGDLNGRLAAALINSAATERLA